MAKRLRMTVTHRAWLGAGIGAALMVVLATTVFACTYIPHLYAVSPTDGTPGTDLTLKGTAATTEHPVTVRWNGLRGPVLGTVIPDAEGNFTTRVKVPDVAPGAYFIVADSGGSDVARAVFTVTGAASAAGAPQAPAVAPQFAAGSDATSVETVPADSSWLSSAFVFGLLLFAAGTVAVVTGFSLVLTRRHRVPTRTR